MRLIDAEPMEDQVKNTYGDTPNLKFGLLRWIAYQPTVDAVSVVRCKDCTHLYGKLCTVCGLLPRKPDDFCSYGERKDGADSDADGSM